MTNTTEEGTTCPECGGRVAKGRSTEAYGYLSCASCEWYERVKDGRYR